MGVSDIPFIESHLAYLPLNKIAKYPDGPPKNGVPFTGYPQQHPTEKNKLILVYDPLGENPTILEFKTDDILYVEDVPQVVTEKGEGIPLAKLWIRMGARGMLLEPFEVDGTFSFLEPHRGQKGKFSNPQSGGSFSHIGPIRL
ncbi:MAG: hypothetical protein LBH42_03185 [Treponema sp.]|jgi:inorganic pyrophosphatase|nr:hypothetical protein [Treponema sp.]